MMPPILWEDVAKSKKLTYEAWYLKFDVFWILLLIFLALNEPIATKWVLPSFSHRNV